ncbi:piggyBac transposable element-derived protein 4-like [Hyperolius riggenbachi]|uniref:piggyBac transposable element-derived protein 4-like n=1 Tax=Hyperolius riggenbachi TaxID=752182 RepID=UPI0035A2B5E6
MTKQFYSAEEACAFLQNSSTSGEESEGAEWLPIDDSESISNSDSMSESERRPAQKVRRRVQSKAISESDSGEEGPSGAREGRAVDTVAATSHSSQGGQSAARPRQNRRRKVPRRDTQVPPEMCDLVWSTPNMEEPNIPPFTASSGLLVETANMAPLDFFQLLNTDQFLEYIVEQTNIYAQQFLADHPSSYYKSKWKPTSITELKAFLGLTFNMDITWKPQVQMYWSKKPIHCMAIYRATMTRGRYQMLMRFLHFNNNDNDLPSDDPDRDRLFKIWPLLNHLNKKFCEVYMPEQNISVDESLVPFHGRLAIKQYIPSKRARYGVKLYKVCESRTGYTYAFNVYEGKDSLLEPAGCPSYLGTTGKIVVDLLNPFLHKGYHLYVDNFYTSVPLFKFLYASETPACGTVRPNRKAMPQQVLHKKLQKGESFSLRSNELLALKYRDKRDVLMLSTIHTEATVTTVSQGETQKKPVAIAEYSKYMGGVDLSDQVLAPYAVHRKTKAWYKKVGIHLLQMTLYNAFVIYKESGNADTYIKFQEDVVSALIGEPANTAHPTDSLECEDVVKEVNRSLMDFMGEFHPYLVVIQDAHKILKDRDRPLPQY